MSSVVGLTRAEMHELRRRAHQKRRAARPPPRVDPDVISAAGAPAGDPDSVDGAVPFPTSSAPVPDSASSPVYVPPPRPYKPTVFNNINPLPGPVVPLAPAPPVVSPVAAAAKTVAPQPAYLLAPFGVSGTMAPNPVREQKLRSETNVPPDVRGTLKNARTENSEIGSFHELLAGSAAPAAAASDGKIGTASAPAEGENAKVSDKNATCVIANRLRMNAAMHCTSINFFPNLTLLSSRQV